MIQRILTAYHGWLWRTPAGGPFYSFGVGALRLLAALVRDARGGVLPLYAASLVYTTLLSLAPLLAISFSVLKGIGAHNQIEPFLKEVLSPLGAAKAADISDRVISFVDKIQVGVLGTVGVAILLYSVIALMRKIENAFNDIWHVSRARGFAQRVRDYLSILLVGPLLLFVSVGMTASLQHAALIDRWLGVRIFETAAQGLFVFVPFFLFIIVFTLLYMVIPNTRVRFAPALAAGALTAVLWKGLGLAFSLFVSESASYAAIYSAFATLILFMIWLYVGWMVVLVGASVSYYLQNPSNMAAAVGQAEWQGQRDQLSVVVLLALVRHFYKTGQGMTLSGLASALNAPRLYLEKTIDVLMEARLIIAEGAIDTAYIPRLAAEETTVADVLARLPQMDATTGRFAGLDALFAQAETARRQVLATATLKQLAMRGEEAT
jgi:membrane protein